MKGSQDALALRAVDQPGGEMADAGAVARQEHVRRDLDIQQGGGLVVRGFEIAQVQHAGKDAMKAGVGDGDGFGEEFGRGAEESTEQTQPGVAGIRGLELGLEIHRERFSLERAVGGVKGELSCVRASRIGPLGSRVMGAGG